MVARVGPLMSKAPKAKDRCGPKRKLAPQSERARINSRRKGTVGELEFAHFLQNHNLNARRGQQFKGGQDSPDIVCEDLTDVHFEVKRCEKGNLYAWLAQAQRDAKHKLPIVAHRRNGEEWVAIVPIEHLIKLLILREGTYL